MLGSVRGVVSNDHSYRDKANPRVPTLFRARKATRFGRTIARSERPGVVEEPGMCRSSLRQVARQRKKERFTLLFHHISVELLRVAFFALKRDAAPGVDGLTWQDYEADLDRKIEDLHARVHRGAYRALPSRRHYIPKADGQQRPLAIAALED